MKRGRYLPLWRAVSDDLAIGIPAAEAASGAKLLPDTGGIDESKKPVVWYGTSIVHGAASTRAGAGFTNRISRAINRTVLVRPVARHDAPSTTNSAIVMNVPLSVTRARTHAHAHLAASLTSRQYLIS